MLDFHARRRSGRELPGGDRPFDPRRPRDGARLLRGRQQQRRDQEGALARQPLPRAGHRAAGSRTSSRATPSPTSFRPASGSTRSRAGTSRSIRSSAGSGRLSGAEPPAARLPLPLAPRAFGLARRRMAIAAAAGCLCWWWLPGPGGFGRDRSGRAQHDGAPGGVPAPVRRTCLRPFATTVDAEIAAAFNADGVVGVSTASAPAPGAAPAYALGGTIQRDGDTIRVITRLTNERSGATLWSDNFNYDGNEVSKVPRHIAVDAGNVVRCGLFGASTYRKPLPDAVLRDYMQFCQGHWDPDMSEGRKALVPAQRVVAAVPDFSWGWAAVAGAYWKVAMSADNDRLAEEARASGRQAADRAVAIDSRNSEASVYQVHADRSARLDRPGRPVEARRRGAAARLRVRASSIRRGC